jgi:hypothetical protein
MMSSGSSWPGARNGVGHCAAAARVGKLWRRPLPDGFAPKCFADNRILHVPDRGAALDQHVTLAGVALVVDVDRSARVVDGAVVDDGAQRRRDLLARSGRCNSTCACG